MALDEPKDGVQPHTVNEIDVIITEDVLPFVEGNLLDYFSDERGEGFAMGPIDGGAGKDGCCGSHSGDDCCSSC
jgi:Fe-S cluster assembly iron-binding protein IscA